MSDKKMLLPVAVGYKQGWEIMQFRALAVLGMVIVSYNYNNLPGNQQTDNMLSSKGDRNKSLQPA